MKGLAAVNGAPGGGKPQEESKIVTVDIPSPEAVVDQVLTQGCRHLIQKNSPWADQELKAASLLEQDLEQFFQYPISIILNPDKVNLETEKSLLIYEKRFNSLSEKEKTLYEIEQLMQSLTKSSTLISDVITVADELFTNVARHASGKKTEKESTNLTNGVLFIGKSSDRLVVGCRDASGSLNIKSLLTRVRDCYRKGLSQAMNMGKGGAGLGSFLILNVCLSYFISVIKGRQTLICATLPLGMGNRKRSTLSKNLHWIEK